MLDKASRPAAGPPPPEPGFAASGSGPGLFRRRWGRAPRPHMTGSDRDTADTTTLDPASGNGALPRDPAAEPTAAHTPPEPTDAGAADSAAGPQTSPAESDIPSDPVPGIPSADISDRRPLVQRAVVVGGGRLLAPDWRERAAQAGAARRTNRQRWDTARGWTLRQLTAVRHRIPTRAELADLYDRRPSAQDLADTARRHRFLLGGLGLTLLLSAGDATAGLLVTDQPPAPGIAHRVAVAHPLQLSTPVPSVRRYLQAIDNGERLREQAVVAAAARATLERAKAEAAAAAAGQEQPWISSGPVPEGALPPGAVPAGPGGFVLPAPGTFTSGFGSRWGTFHRGIDVAGPIGTPIYAVANGTVIDAGPAQGFGLWVRIRHDDGTISVYGHMYDFFVSVGERVPAGMQIARMGNRGDSTGPHLHFEIIMDGQHVDPQRWLALHGLSYG